MSCLICTEEGRNLYGCATCTIDACLECIVKMNNKCPAKCGSTTWIDRIVDMTFQQGDSFEDIKIRIRSRKDDLKVFHLTFKYNSELDKYKLGGAEAFHEGELLWHFPVYPLDILFDKVFELSPQCTIIKSDYKIEGFKNPKVKFIEVSFIQKRPIRTLNRAIKLEEEDEPVAIGYVKVERIFFIFRYSLIGGDQYKFETINQVHQKPDKNDSYYECYGCEKRYVRPIMCARHTVRCKENFHESLSEASEDSPPYLSS